MKTYSFTDNLIKEIDKGLRSLNQAHVAKRESPANLVPTKNELSANEQKHSAGLMRVNHCGEVCAQALYQGQYLTAKKRYTQNNMEHAAQEEIDHLVWCEERLKQLNSNTSVLNPLWYGLSFSLGATAGLLGDEISLGFVAATEEQVCEHIEEHLNILPEADVKSRSILEKMLKEEQEHGQHALTIGGKDFPKPIKDAMSLASKLMTKTSYHI